MSIEVIQHAVEHYRECAKGDRSLGEVGEQAADEDDAMADLLEYIASISKETRVASADLVLITEYASVFCEKYLGKLHE